MRQRAGVEVADGLRRQERQGDELPLAHSEAHRERNKASGLSGRDSRSSKMHVHHDKAGSLTAQGTKCASSESKGGRFMLPLSV